MKRLLVRNKVKDFDTWKSFFDEGLEGAAEAGLKLESLWRSIEDPNEAFFVFTVESVEAAQGFMADPASQEMGRRSGVIDGQAWFVE